MTVERESSVSGSSRSREPSERLRGVTTTPTPTPAVDLTAAPRAVLRESVRLLNRVLGEDRLGSAQANAWAAICVDRERARERAEVARLIASARGRR